MTTSYNPTGVGPTTAGDVIPSRADRPRLEDRFTIDTAADALHEVQLMVGCVDRRDSVVAAHHAARAIKQIDQVLDDYGIELTEVLPHKTCSDCKRTDVIEYRRVQLEGGTRMGIVCASCWLDRRAAERELAQAARATSADILARAAQIITERATVYGDAKTVLERTGLLWTSLLRGRSIDLDNTLTASDVALMMIGLKLARLADAPDHHDSWVDAAGYAGLGGELAHGGRDGD